MKRSDHRILTTHAGSLPRPESLQDLIRTWLNGQPYDQDALDGQVELAVNDAVRRQAEAGVDIISDGEQGKTGFLLYGSQRLAGFEQVELRPGQRSRARRRDQVAFAEFYEEYFKTVGRVVRVVFVANILVADIIPVDPSMIRPRPESLFGKVSA